MAVSLKHAFTSGKSDGADATLIQPSNWNAEHTLSLATNTLLGRTTAGTGAAEEISVGSGLTLASGTLNGSDIDYPFNDWSGGTASSTFFDLTLDLGSAYS